MAIKIFTNEEFRKGDIPITTPIATEIRLFLSTDIKQIY